MAVKTATAYTLAKIAEFCFEVLFDNSDNLDKMINTLKQNLY